MVGFCPLPSATSAARASSVRASFSSKRPARTGYRVPVPMPPAAAVLGPQPKQIMYKHALHLIIPKDKWVGQYNMWEQYHLIVKDDGIMELKKAEVKL